MRKISIEYNPYQLKTIIKDEEKDVSLEETECFSFVTGHRLQQWIAPAENWEGFISALSDYTGGEDTEVHFAGRRIDCDDLRRYLKECPNVKLTQAQRRITADKDVAKRLDDLVSKLKVEGKHIDFFPTEKIDKQYQKLVNGKFSVNVIANMSSGKSTLINALIGQDLLPARNEATTAKITTILDSDRVKGFTVRCRDQSGKQITEEETATLERINELNNNPDVAYIDVAGDIPMISSRQMRLEIIDTPGEGNANSDEHDRITDDLIINSSDSHSVMLYVVDATSQFTKIDDSTLKKISKAIKAGGKEIADSFIFVLNKADEIDQEKESFENTLEQARNYLKKFEIENPNIFVTSARTAKLVRTEKNSGKLTQKEKNDLESMSRDYIGDNPYYEMEKYALLSPTAEEKLKRELKKAQDNNDTISAILIRCGVRGLEIAIQEFLEKYAYPIKVKSFTDYLHAAIDEKEMYNSLAQKIDVDEATLLILGQKIGESKKKEEELTLKAKSVEQSIAKLRFDPTALEQIQNKLNIALNRLVTGQREEANKSNQSGSSVSAWVAIFSSPNWEKRTNIKENESNEILEKFSVAAREEIKNFAADISQTINQDIMKTSEAMLSEYNTLLRDMSCSIQLPGIDLGRVLALQDCQVADLDALQRRVREHSKEELYSVPNPAREGFWGFFKFWQPWTITRTRPVVSSDELKKIISTEAAKIINMTDAAILDCQAKAELELGQFKKEFDGLISNITQAVHGVVAQLDTLYRDKNEHTYSKEKNEELKLWLETQKEEIKNILVFEEL